MQAIGHHILLKNEKIINALGITEPTDYEVVSIGGDVTKVKVGDKVFYQQGALLTILGQEYVDVDEENIIATL